MEELANRKIRAGTDTQVIAESVRHRLQYDAPTAAMWSPDGTPPGGNRASRVLYRAASWVYRRMKPVARPVAHRFRSFVNGPIEKRLDHIEVLLGGALSGLLDQRAAYARIEDYAARSVKRVAIPCADGQILVRTEVGYVLCSAADPAVLVVLLEAGEFERGVRVLIQRFLRPGDVFVDIGANLGLHTLAAARTLGGHGRVLAFEPYEETHRLLAATVWMNGFSGLVETQQTAVSNRNGMQKLHLAATSGHNSLFALDNASGASGRTVDVPVVRLDEAVPAGTSIALMKIDVEGAELDVVEGADNLLRSNPDIGLVVEFGRLHLQRTGQTTASWLQRFQDLGFVFKALHPEEGTLRSCTVADLNNVDSVNLFFARPGSPAWARANAAE